MKSSLVSHAAHIAFVGTCMSNKQLQYGERKKEYGKNIKNMPEKLNNKG